MKTERMEQEICKISQKVDEILGSNQEERYQKIYVLEREIPEILRKKDTGIYYLGVMTRCWCFHQNPIKSTCFGSCRNIAEIAELCQRIRWILYHMEQNFGSDELTEDMAYLVDNQVDEVLLCHIAKEHLQNPVRAIRRLSEEYQRLGQTKKRVHVLLIAVEILGNERELLLKVANAFLEIGNLEQALHYLQKLEKPSEQENQLMQSITRHLQGMV